MFGHGRLADAKAIDELTDGPFAVAEQIEDRQPARFRQNLERSECRHQPDSIPFRLYVCQVIESGDDFRG
jgi:hypothetical protein